MGSSGLGTSMWASRKRPYEPYRFDTRSRSVPAQPPIATVQTTDTSIAPPPQPSNVSGTASLSPIQAFHRFEQACQRLRWKYIDLETSYKRALAPEAWHFSPQDAERNFKVDFHEFYIWIEQALVLALLIFDVVVPRGQGFSGDGAYRDEPTRASRSYAAHNYHHNVLKSLDDEDNPLHEALGSGDVNHALWKAKELRNRWKDAAEGRETPPLKMYDLTWIVGTVLGGLEAAYGLANSRVEQVKMEANGNAENIEEADAWEWMVEPMDWEA